MQQRSELDPLVLGDRALQARDFGRGHFGLGGDADDRQHFQRTAIERNRVTASAACVTYDTTKGVDPSNFFSRLMAWPRFCFFSASRSNE